MAKAPKTPKGKAADAAPASVAGAHDDTPRASASVFAVVQTTTSMPQTCSALS